MTSSTVLIAAAILLVLVVLAAAVVVVRRSSRPRAHVLPPPGPGGEGTGFLCPFCKRPYAPAQTGGRCPACGAAAPRT